MKKRLSGLIMCMFVSAVSALGQTSGNQQAPGSDFKIALPTHPGQLQWRADGFKIIETSAKSKGQEIGVRGVDGSGRLFFLGFLFLVSENAPLTSAKCREGVLKELRQDPKLKILATPEIARSDNVPVALVSYATQGNDGKKWYSVRGFVGSGDTCGDLEFYSLDSIGAEDAALKPIFESYRLDPRYIPQFTDTFFYAQILYQHQMYAAAGPLFEQAVAQLGDDKAQQTMRRVTIDQAGMSYGISGNIPKSRALFEAAIAKDPDYPLYYYNLACADAEEKKLSDARVHLQQAFARKQNMIPGETFPDPKKDDSFLPYRNDKDFWNFLEGLH
jgi:hypothetical protein